LIERHVVTVAAVTRVQMTVPCRSGGDDGCATAGRPGLTSRTDRWWAEPLATGLGLALLFGYLTVRAFYPAYVWHEPYISPTVAPPVFTAPAGPPGGVPVDRAWLGAFPAWWPAFAQSPAFVLPWLAIVFRVTCYYYRGAYYKAPFLTPPACAVRGVPRRYRGEASLLLFQNLHRYALYAGLFLLVVLWWEAGAAFFRRGEFGIGLGTVIMVVNAALLSSWTLGCHSWRHLAGGRHDCFSCKGPSLRYPLWRGSTWLNERHMLFAWCSLAWVALTDVYVLLVSSGTLRDINTWSP
jgi:hypothetical protein